MVRGVNVWPGGSVKWARPGHLLPLPMLRCPVKIRRGADGFEPVPEKRCEDRGGSRIRDKDKTLAHGGVRDSFHCTVRSCLRMLVHFLFPFGLYLQYSFYRCTYRCQPAFLYVLCPCNCFRDLPRIRFVFARGLHSLTYFLELRVTLMKTFS